MLTSISAKGFRGLEFDQSLSPKTLFVGNNGAGKSARSDAAIFLLTGSLPGKALPDLILDTYGSDNKMSVGGRINGTRFDRILSRDKKGTVTQTMMLNTRKAKKEEFAVALVEAKAPKVVDLSAFISLSNQKKIDYIFELFPPAEDLGKLKDEIQALQEKINAKHADIRDGEKLIASLTETKAGMQLPSGTLAETRAAIEKALEAHKESSKQIKALEIEAAKAEAKKKADAEAEEQRKADIAKAEAKLRHEHEERQKKREAEIRKEEQEKAAKAAEKLKAETKPEPPIDTFKEAEEGAQMSQSGAGQHVYTGPVTYQPIKETMGVPANGNGLESLLRVKAAMERVGCTTCAAGIILKVEIKKHQPIKF